MAGGLDSYTKFLSHFNGADGIPTPPYLAETGQEITFNVTAQISTTQKKFGSGSLLLDGNSDYVTIPTSSDFYLEDHDFTIDAWIKLVDTGRFQAIAFQGLALASTRSFSLFVSTHDKFYGHIYGTPTAGIGGGDNPIPLNDSNWHHIALVRYNNVLTFYTDGISSVNSTYDATGETIHDSGEPIRIGMSTAANPYYFGGYIDEFRVSPGTARWRTDFTPPTSEYSKFVARSSIII